MERTAIAIKEQDNVATAIKDIPAGQEAAVGVGEQTLMIPVTQDNSGVQNCGSIPSVQISLIG